MSFNLDDLFQQIIDTEQQVQSRLARVAEGNINLLRLFEVTMNFRGESRTRTRSLSVLFINLSPHRHSHTDFHECDPINPEYNV